MKPRERAEVGEVAEIDARAKGKDRVGWHSPELQGAGQTEVNRFLGALANLFVFHVVSCEHRDKGSPTKIIITFFVHIKPRISDHLVCFPAWGKTNTQKLKCKHTSLLTPIQAINKEITEKLQGLQTSQKNQRMCKSHVIFFIHISLILGDSVA